MIQIDMDKPKDCIWADITNHIYYCPLLNEYHKCNLQDYEPRTIEEQYVHCPLHEADPDTVSRQQAIVIDALDALSSFPQISLDTISRQDTIEAMEGVDWYHIDSNGRLVHGANSKKDEPLYKVEDVYKVLEQMPSAQSEENCENCKHGSLKDSRCDNCRVGCMGYPSYYERKTYG